MLPGGKGDKAEPSDFDPHELKMGIEVEMEHTKSRKIAREIAMDHLSEDPRYYTKLKKVHKEHAYMRSDMHSIEELLQLMSNVNAWLTEGAAPPPFKAAERQAAGMPALKSRTGATPPPIPAAAKKPKEVKPLAQFGQRAFVPSKTPKGDKNIGVTRGMTIHTAAGAKSSPETKQAIGWAKKASDARGVKGESLRDTASAIRDLIGEAAATFGGARISNQPIIRKPRKMILRPKPLVAAGSKLKPGTSPGGMPGPGPGM